MSGKPSEHTGDTHAQRARALRFHGRGTCLARLEDDPDDAHVLVHNALPHELLSIRPLDLRGRRRWTVTRVLEPSSQRVVPDCPHAANCSGCALLHLNRHDEIAAKCDVLTEILERHAGLTMATEDIEVVATTSRFGLRTRASWRISTAPGQPPRAAFRPLDGPWPDTRNCPAVTAELRSALSELLHHASNMDGRNESDVELEIVNSAVVLTVQSGDPLWPASRDAALLATSSVRTVLERAQTSLRVRSGQWPGTGDPSVWRHATPTCGTLLKDWVCAGQAPPVEATLLDATCGGGELLTALAPLFSAAVAVDQHHPSVLEAARRCRGAGFAHVDVRGGRIQTVAPRLMRDGARFHTTLVNPMRRSLGDETMAVLASITMRRLVYLAPAPRAGASDLAILVTEGWKPRRTALVDLHPGTASMMLAIDLEHPDAR